MHMADILVAHPAVFGSTLALGGLAVAVAARRVRTGLDEGRLPLLGVLGAFVFAGQMVNFTLPGLYTSGHLGGAALLTTLFGPAAAVLVMAAVLVIQCLLFQDGGVLALGANLIAMGVVPALVTAGVARVVRPAVPGLRGVLLGAAAGAWLGLLAGAVLVPLAAAASGALPSGVRVTTFLAVMLGLHALIGVGEALITVATLAFLQRVRPDLVDRPPVGRGTLRAGRVGGLVAAGLLVSLAIGGGVSHLASPYKDGLERAATLVGVLPGETEGDVLVEPGVAADVHARALAATAARTPSAAEDAAGRLVAETALLSDYEHFPGLPEGRLAMTLAGATGTLLVFLLLWGVSVAFARRNAPVATRERP